MINVIVPIGKQRTFEGPSTATPVILNEFAGRVLLDWSLDAIRALKEEHKIFFIFSRELEERYSLASKIEAMGLENYEVVITRMPTNGMPCSILFLIDRIGPNESVVVWSCDHYVEFDLSKPFQNILENPAIDAGVFWFESTNPNWSFIVTDQDDLVTEVREKYPISTKALASIYAFKNAEDLFNSIKDYIARGVTTNGKYYLAQSLNELLLDEKAILAQKIEGEEYINVFEHQQLIRLAEKLVPFSSPTNQDLVVLTYCYVEAFNSKDIEQLKNLFADDMTLIDPNFPPFVGKEATIEFLSDLFETHRSLKFAPQAVFSATRDRTVIQFELTLGTLGLHGVDIIDWTNGGKICAITAYVNQRER